MSPATSFLSFLFLFCSTKRCRLLNQTIEAWGQTTFSLIFVQAHQRSCSTVHNLIRWNVLSEMSFDQTAFDETASMRWRLMKCLQPVWHTQNWLARCAACVVNLMQLYVMCNAAMAAHISTALSAGAVPTAVKPNAYLCTLINTGWIMCCPPNFFIQHPPTSYQSPTYGPISWYNQSIIPVLFLCYSHMPNGGIGQTSVVAERERELYLSSLLRVTTREGVPGGRFVRRRPGAHGPWRRLPPAGWPHLVLRECSWAARRPTARNYWCGIRGVRLRWQNLRWQMRINLNTIFMIVFEILCSRNNADSAFP